MARLQTVSKTLSEEVRAASAERQRAAVLAACDFALSSVREVPPGVLQVYARLKAGAKLEGAELELLERARDAHDDRYLELQEKEDPLHMKEFALARALSAMRFAAEPTSFMSAADAIYEASCVDDERAKFVQTIHAALHG